MHTKRLRFHHLLCLPLFKGEGYSDDFSVNVQSVKELLESEGPTLRFVCSSDMICQSCPNRRKSGCALDDREGSVSDKDKRLADISGFEEDTELGYFDALKAVRRKMTAEDFTSLCGECRWNKMGLCSYEKWLENANALLNR